LLSNGKVLFAGGGLFDGVSPATNTAELYDPSTGMWSLTGNLSGPRAGHAATLLQGGKVLVAGGCRDEECFPIQVGSAEIYDPNTQTWSITGSLNTPRDSGHNLTTLPNGNVLLSGGAAPFPTNEAELYNAATGQWSNTGSLLKRRALKPVTLLHSGKALVVGGRGANTRHVKVFNSAELYDPATGKWNGTASLNTARWAHTATLLSDGKVLVVGGHDGIGHLRSAELYDPEILDPAPKIINASVSGKKLFITGEDFDDGAVILLNGEEQKSKNDEQNPQTILIGKKAGKKIKPGDRVQVRNPNGSLSEEFTFTGL
jgi:N-acetylneuraminic acid mutarotase